MFFNKKRDLPIHIGKIFAVKVNNVLIRFAYYYKTNEEIHSFYSCINYQYSLFAKLEGRNKQ